MFFAKYGKSFPTEQDFAAVVLRKSKTAEAEIGLARVGELAGEVMDHEFLSVDELLDGSSSIAH